MDIIDLSICDYIEADGVLRVPPELASWPKLVWISNRPDLVAIEGLVEVPNALHLHRLPNLRSFGSIQTVRGPVSCFDCPGLTELGALRVVHGNADLRGTGITDAEAQGLKVLIGPSQRPVRILSATPRQAFVPAAV